MDEVTLGIHLLSDHGVGVYSLGKHDSHLHAMLHHPSQTGQPDHDHMPVRDEAR